MKLCYYSEKHDIKIYRDTNINTVDAVRLYSLFHGGQFHLENAPEELIKKRHNKIVNNHHDLKYYPGWLHLWTENISYL